MSLFSPRHRFGTSNHCIYLARAETAGKVCLFVQRMNAIFRSNEYWIYFSDTKYSIKYVISIQCITLIHISPQGFCFQRLCSLEWAKGSYYRENKGRFRKINYPRLNRHSSAHSDELTLKWLLSILIKSQTLSIKANSVTWHNWLWITSCDGYGSLNKSCLMADNSVHSVIKWIGDSIEFGRLHRQQISSLHRLVSFRCFFHQLWPVKNWMHHPRCSLDMLSSLEARIGSGPVHQNLVWACPLMFSHLLAHWSAR